MTRRNLSRTDSAPVKAGRVPGVPELSVAQSAEPDLFAMDAEDRQYNLEIQRRDTVDHPRCVRFYTSMIDSESPEKGHAYAELPNLCVIYISETNLLGMGKAVNELNRSLPGMKAPYKDGLRVLYVNAAVKGGSETDSRIRNLTIRQQGET